MLHAQICSRFAFYFHLFMKHLTFTFHAVIFDCYCGILYNHCLVFRSLHYTVGEYFGQSSPLGGKVS